MYESTGYSSFLLIVLVAQQSLVATYIRGVSIVELGRSQVAGGVAPGWGNNKT